MDNVEPLGIDGDEQAFRVEFKGVTAIVFYNKYKGKPRCSDCQPALEELYGSFPRDSCEHVQMVEMYLEVNVQTFDWMGHIAYTLDNWTRTAYRCLWSMLSDGLLFEKPIDYEAAYESIQRKLESMKEHELGYLRLMGAPDCLDDDFLEPYWTNAQDWLEESGAMAVYYNDGQYLIEDRGTKGISTQ